MPGLGDTRRRSPSNDSLRERCATVLSSLGSSGGRQSHQGPLVTHKLVNGLLLLLGIRLLLTGVFVYVVAPDPLLVGLFHLVLSIPRLARRVSDGGQQAGWRGIVAERLPSLQSDSTRSSRSSRSSRFRSGRSSRSSRSSRSRSSKERL